MKIYDFPPSPNAVKVRAVAYELGLTPEWTVVNIFKGESRTPEFLAKNPNGHIPLLEDGNFILWESNAILNYLAAKHPEGGLFPAELKARAEVDKWLFWQTGHLGPAVAKVVGERVVKPLRGSNEAPDQTIIDAGLAEFRTCCEVMEKCLADREYLAGKLSVADFAVASFLAWRQMIGLSIDSFAKVTAWQLRIEQRGSFQKAVADAQAHMPRR